MSDKIDLITDDSNNLSVLIIFDNLINNKNCNIIIGHLKRWIIYLVTIFTAECNYRKITIVKTVPTTVTFELILNNENFEKNINIINNIIFKTYTDFNNNLFKIMNLIKDTKIEYNKILIISSICNLNINNEDMLNICNISEESKKNINILNIARNSLFLNLPTSLSELKVDYKDFKINKLYTNFNMFLDVNNKIKRFEDIDEIEFYGDSSLIKHVIKLNWLETNIFNNKLCDNDYGEYINFLNTVDIVKNYTINTIINNYHNNIRKLLYYKINKILNIEELVCSDSNTNITNTNIEYLLQFYELIYPKILANNYNKKFSNNIRKFSKIKIIDILQIQSDTITDNSKNILVSNITMSSWIDEYNSMNPFGILIKYHASSHSYKGLIDENSNILTTYPNICISSVGNNWISVLDYYHMITAEIDNDEKFKETFNINNYEITDNLHGSVNIMLPIYINKNHWKLTKLIWTYHLSFINNSLEYEYNKKMDNIYLFVLLKHCNSLINTKIKNYNIILLIYLLRTQIQILVDNKYLFSIKKEYDLYLQNLLNCSKHDSRIRESKINNIFIEYIIRLLQLIISGNTSIEEINIDISKVVRLFFNTYVSIYYDSSFYEYYNELDESNKNSENNLIVEKFVEDYQCFLNLINDLTIIGDFIINIYKLYGFNKFLKITDKFNGCIPESCLECGNYTCNNVKTIIEKSVSNYVFNINRYNLHI
jgi:hypothetical protein